MISTHKRLSISIFGFVLALLFVYNPGYSQSEVIEKESTKKVVIVKKTVDEDGNETVEKKVMVGEEADAYLESQEIELESILEEEIENNIELGGSETEVIDLDALNESLLLELENIEIPDIDVDVLKSGEGHYKIRIIEDGQEINWEGDEAIPSELKEKLERIHMEHPAVHGEDAIVWIQEDQPDRAVLGVMVENAGGNGAMVTDVFDGSGAQKAGLQKGDIITKVNSSKVIDIESLVASMKDSKVGDDVKVRFLRNGKKKSEKVELGKMPAQKRFMHKDHKMDCHPKHGKKLECHVKNIEKPVHHNKTKINKIVVVKKKGDNDEVEVITEDIKVEPSEIDIYQLNVYPNPSDGEINVEFSAAAVPTTVKIVSLDGKEIYTKYLQDFDGQFYDRIDLKGADGGAILQIHQNGKVFTEAIMK
jgi:hypothetical protein